VDHDACTGCKACLRLGCPAITWDEARKKSNIDKFICVGCKVCQQTCGFSVLSRK
jgi:indolepyruvate ferredoxin oxidoreductase, alpha subunit